MIANILKRSLLRANNRVNTIDNRKNTIPKLTRYFVSLSLRMPITMSLVPGLNHLMLNP
jgi:hypothetical protein